MRITPKIVRESQDDDSDVWFIGNQTLYDLCSRYPYHDDDSPIVAKVWLIGRAYSASIERGRGNAPGSALSNDRFYKELVPKALRESALDMKLANLEELTELNEANVPAILETHGFLVRLFLKLTNKSKRSLASKYLHFHRRDLFFILDSRALLGIRGLGLPRVAIDIPPGADEEYARFVSAALGVREHVASAGGPLLSPRQLDRLLLAVSSSRSSSTP
jgi:hypothetical protein